MTKHQSSPGLAAKLATLTAITGLSISSLLNAEPSSALTTDNSQEDTSSSWIRKGDSTLLAQAAKSKNETLAKQKEIRFVLEKAMKSGDIKQALKGSSLDSSTQKALLQLSAKDLKTLKSTQKKLAPIDTKGLFGGWIF